MDPCAFSPPNQANNQENVTVQLDFNESMNHFKTMFPDIDSDVIETVLRANNGAVVPTIDQLLQINNESSKNELPINPPSYSASVSPQLNLYNQNLNINSVRKEKVQKITLKQMDLLNQQPPNNQLIDFDTIDAQVGACSSSFRNPKLSRFQPPLLGDLPHDFLRIVPVSEKNSNHHYSKKLIRQSSTPSNDHQINHQLLKKKIEENERQRLNSNIDDKEISQYLEDERMALMLQNEEFISELRTNRDFMNALNYDTMNHNQTKVKGFHNENYASNFGAHGGNTYADANTLSDSDFKEKLKKMNELSKKKFAQLAGLFSRRKGALVPLRDNNLLLGDQYSQLENDYSDSEEYGQKKTIHPKQH